MSYDHLSREELIARLRVAESRFDEGDRYVTAPEQYAAIFEAASNQVKAYFEQIKTNPSSGTITIDDERYILVRASALSSDFFEIVTNLYADSSQEEGFIQGRNFLFDVAHVIGSEDARIFHQKLGLHTPIEKLAAGPIHFAMTGWAYVELLPECNPVPTNDFFLKYTHPYSFEADSWIKKGRLSTEPVCVMNAAYSAAWCSESFGLDLSSAEISCKACGDETCTFIMAPKDQLDSYLKKEKQYTKRAHQTPPPLFFERKKVEEKLRSSEQMLNDAQEMAQVGSWQFDLLTQDLSWSEQLFAIFNVNPNDTENLYATYLSKIPPDEAEKLNKLVQHTLETGESYQFQHAVLADADTLKWVWCTGIPVKNGKGEIIALKGVIQDISEKLNLQMELDSFFEMSIDLLCIANERGYFLKVSPSWCKLLGYTEEELCRLPFVHFVHPDDAHKTVEETQRMNNGDMSLRFENRYRKKNGEYVTLSWNAMINMSNGLIYATARDISKQKEKEVELQLNILEKETLLKEIHHRVKNNLQIISSLLSLQAKMNRKNEKLNRLYEDSMNRINSMAALHELFYQSDNFQRINFAEYLSKLTHDLVQSYRGHSHQIQVDMNVRPSFLNLDTAVPLGLVVNEILTNTFKHAFWNQENGQIYVELEGPSEQKLYTLKIGDNGRGISPTITLEESETLGLSLIHDLTAQLDGKVELKNEKGTHYTLTFSEQ